MLEFGIVYIGAEGPIARALRQLVPTVTDLRLCRADDIASAWATDSTGPESLWIYHLHSDGSRTAIRRLLQEMPRADRPQILILADQDDARDAELLKTLGACDYLPISAFHAMAGVLRDHIAARQGRNGDEERLVELRLGLPQHLADQLRRVALQDANILLGGETGTGKTRLARTLHKFSGRSEHPFLTVNCGALSETLIDSELFGHIRGAFTGADRDRVGKLLEVGSGTLLLDEVDSLSPATQAKLLRVIEERRFEPVGSNQTLQFKARLIAASNRMLEKEVEAGRFRADLFYRLEVICFELPPLRSRREIIPELVGTFLGDLAGASDYVEFDREAMATLLRYDWPGNIRQLRNVVERALVLRHGPIITTQELPEHIVRSAAAAGIGAPASVSIPMALPHSMLKDDAMKVSSMARPAAASPAGEDLASSLSQYERARIIAALQANGNNRYRAALSLGISRMTLYNKIHKYGLGLRRGEGVVGRIGGPDGGVLSPSGLPGAQDEWAIAEVAVEDDLESEPEPAAAS